MKETSMTEMSLTHPRLGTINLDLIPITILPEGIIVRVFFPRDISGFSPHEIAAHVLDLRLNEPVDPTRYNRAAPPTHAFTSDMDPRRTRMFDGWNLNPHGKNYSPDFDYIISRLGARGQSYLDQLRTISRPDTHDSDYRGVVYERPTIEIPFTPPEVVRYTKLFLDSFAAFRHANGSGSRALFRKSMREEAARAHQWLDLVERAVQIRSPVLAAAKTIAAPIPDWSEHDCPVDSKFIACLERWFDVEAADVLITEALKRAGKQQPSDRTPLSDSSSQPPRWVYLFSRWVDVSLIVVNLSDRTEPARFVMRLLDDYHVGILEELYAEIFRVIRHDQRFAPLTRPEWRLYSAMYYRNPVVNGRIPALEPAVVSFFRLDNHRPLERYIRLAVLGRLRDRSTSPEWEELRCNWLSFVRTYPSWHEIRRDEEREGRAGAEENEDVAALVQVHFEDNPKAGGISVTESRLTLEQLLQCCTPRERLVIERHDLAGESLTAIAPTLGVTQQMVSKIHSAAMSKLRLRARQESVREAEL